jgi:hypothetical protein
LLFWRYPAYTQRLQVMPLARLTAGVHVGRLSRENAVASQPGK